VADNSGSGGSGAVRLAAIRDAPLSLDEVVGAVRDPAAGGLAVFVGAVRDVDGGRAVDSLGYSAHPSAERELARVATSVAGRWPVIAVAVVHRIGELALGDDAVVLAVSAAHRDTALEAARALIDELKATVPIWKHQRFADGGEEWVGTP
jgi:molybdopterin synthase catalytic subunit